MFQDFSQRAIRVMFSARLEAGRRGAETLEVEDLLSGIIVEDHGTGQEAVCDTETAHSHRPFFASDVAKVLQSELEKIVPASDQTPPSTDIPISPTLQKTLEMARGIKERFGKERIEPLHLLAALVETEATSRAARLLQEVGIMQDKILKAIEGETA